MLWGILAGQKFQASVSRAGAKNQFQAKKNLDLALDGPKASNFRRLKKKIKISGPSPGSLSFGFPGHEAHGPVPVGQRRLVQDVPAALGVGGFDTGGGLDDGTPLGRWGDGWGNSPPKRKKEEKKGGGGGGGGGGGAGKGGERYAVGPKVVFADRKQRGQPLSRTFFRGLWGMGGELWVHEFEGTYGQTPDKSKEMRLHEQIRPAAINPL